MLNIFKNSEEITLPKQAVENALGEAYELGKADGIIIGSLITAGVYIALDCIWDAVSSNTKKA